MPLLENVGAPGMYITAFCRDAEEAETLLKAVEDKGLKNHRKPRSPVAPGTH